MENGRTYDMTNEQTIMISRLMKDGMGYRKIAEELDLPVNSVKSWCRRHPCEEEKAEYCPVCGKEIFSLPHKRVRKFCSDGCRYAWWSAHPEERTIKTGYTHTCRHCGCEFTNNRKTADYCCRECFADARRKAV